MPLKVAIVFTLGCSVLVINAVISFIPFIGLRFELPSSTIYVEGALSFTSCTIFLMGSIFSFFETLNMNQQPHDYFGWQWNDAKLESIDEAIGEKATSMPHVPAAHYMHHNSSHAQLFSHSREASPVRSSEPEKRSIGPPSEQTWQYLDSNTKRRTYLDLGIVASAIFLTCSAVYCSTSVASLITIFAYGYISRWIRYPQLVAAAGFAVASLMLMIKSQRDYNKEWWRPAIYSLGWYINFWNFVGSAGFFACAYFGLLQNVHWAEFQFGCSYLWGSWAMLLGSTIQWYRAVRKKATLWEG